MCTITYINHRTGAIYTDVVDSDGDILCHFVSSPPVYSNCTVIIV